MMRLGRAVEFGLHRGEQTRHLPGERRHYQDIIAPIAGAIGGGLGDIGVGATTAGDIGAIAAPALLGAGVGAGASALTGGSPLNGALIGGGLGAGYGAIGPGGPLNSTLFGDAAGAGSAGIDPSTGAMFGAGSMPTGTNVTGTAPTDSGGNSPTPVYNAPPSGGSGGGGGGGIAGGDSGSTGGLFGGKINNTSLALGALAALGSAMSKPQQLPYGNTPGPAQVSANLGPYFNQPLNTNVPGRTPTTPNVPSYYKYGALPEQQYFSGNSLQNFGFARGGPLRHIGFDSAQPDRHVRGPGGPETDSIPARLSDGEYVMDARDVSRIGGGDNNRGAKILDHARKRLDRNRGPLARLAGGAA